jgi:hypothetical protein
VLHGTLRSCPWNLKYFTKGTGHIDMIQLCRKWRHGALTCHWWW